MGFLTLKFNKRYQKMNAEDLIIRLLETSSKEETKTEVEPSSGLSGMLGRYCIIRTYSAGVLFGILDQKSGNEVILTQARRMYRWKALESISLSAVATHGIDHKNSKICEAVDQVWLEAIEIIPCTATAISLIKDAKNVQAQ